MEIKDVVFYEVISNTDLNEGRGASVVIGRYMDSCDAEAAAKGQGVFGSDAKVESKTKRAVIAPNNEKDGRYGSRTFLLGEEIYSDFINLEDLKKQALAKLSDKEKAVLGLK